jgi:type II secretory ATPase GspE/PulE/Tfp pilus assembly ATPase PilB-like protein
VGDKEITEGEQEASVIKFVNQVIWEAYKDRATDIHLEPQEDELRIRYRIQGDERDEHRGETPAAGRTHQRPDQGRGD